MWDTFFGKPVPVNRITTLFNTYKCPLGVLPTTGLTIMGLHILRILGVRKFRYSAMWYTLQAEATVLLCELAGEK